MSIDSERYFGGRMNTDDSETGDPRLVIQNGDYRKAYYLRSGSSGSEESAALESFAGNTEIVNSILPSGTNTFIGSCKYIEKSSLIFFFHNSSDNHNIVILNTITNTFQLVLQSPELNFSLNHRIYWANVVDGLLKWTDGRDSTEYYSSGVRLFNPPMGINIQDAIDGLYTTVDLQAIETMKWPPRYAPLVAYGTTPEVPNKIKNLILDFRYQYIYADNEQSAWSPISERPMPTNEDWASGPDYANQYADNYLAVTVNAGHYRVKKFRIAVRVNDGIFAICHEVNKADQGIADNSEYIFYFYNNQTLTPLSIVIPNNDNVPQTTFAQEYLQSNEIAYANYRNGYDSLVTDFQARYRLHELADWKPDYCNYLSVSNLFITSDRPYFKVDDDTRFDYSIGDTYTIAITVEDPSSLGNILLTYSVTEEDIATALLEATVELQNKKIAELMCTQFATQINTAFGSDFVEINDTNYATLGIGILPINAGTQDFTVEDYVRDPNITSTSSPIKPTRKYDTHLSLKKGWTYYFAIQYYDRGQRDGTVQFQTSQYELNIPFPCNEDDRINFTNPNSPYYVTFDMLINNIPPIWATHYQIVTRKVRSSFIHKTIADQIIIDPSMPSAYKITLDNYSEANYGAKMFHSISEGDLVRIVTKNMPLDVSEPAEYMESFIELPVLKFDPSGGGSGNMAIWIPIFDYNTMRNVEFASSQVLEIYTPTREDNQKDWFEIGEESAIGSPHTDNRYHTSPSTITGNCIQANFADTFVIVEGDKRGSDNRDFVNSESLDDYGIIMSETYDPVLDQTTYNLLNPIPGGLPTAPFPFVVSFDQVVSGGISTSEAYIVSDWGDVYLRNRDMQTGFGQSVLPPGLNTHCYFMVEDPARSDYYDSALYTLGRVALENSENRTIKRKSSVIHSKKYLDNTLINGLSSFTGENNYRNLDESRGDIVCIISQNKTLHCVQKEVTTPIYDGTFAVDNNGDVSQPAYSNTTFSSVGRAVPVGCVHPSTIKIIDNKIFVYDFYRGSVFVLTDNGHTDICDGQYKFKKAILQKTKEVSNNFETSFIAARVDSYNKEYGLHFFTQNDDDEPIYDSPVFNYEKGAWTHWVNYPLLWAENFGNYLVSTEGYKIWQHNVGDESNYYGEQYTPYFEFVFNERPNLVKRPFAIGVKSNKLLSVDSVTTRDNETYAVMETEIPSSLFKRKKGALWAAYLRDKNNIVAELDWLDTAEKALFNGREVVGFSHLHRLSVDDPTQRTIISSVVVCYQLAIPQK